MKKGLKAMALFFSFMLVSCGQLSNSTDGFIDPSGARYSGEIKQEIAMGCDFIDESEHPYLVYEQYLSEDNEEFCYDKKGRLCRYKNKDSIFYGRVSTDTEHEMNDNEVESYCYEIATYYLEPNYSFETTFNAETGVLHIDGINEQNNDYRESATVKVNRSGDICYIKVRYNTLEQPVDDEMRIYFDNKANEYFKTECERLGDDIYNIDSVRYEQLNSKLYAIFTCTFRADNGAEYCESVGFSRELQDTL